MGSVLANWIFINEISKRPLLKRIIERIRELTGDMELHINLPFQTVYNQMKK